MKFKKILIFVCALLVLGLVSASPYMVSNPKFTQAPMSSFRDVPQGMEFNTDMCQEGQDFVLQIDPMGCSPTIVRSDLLAEQDVRVFCPIRATKINPLINIESVYNMNLAVKDRDPSVKSVGFFPAKAALGGDRQLNDAMMNNIGYATIVIGQQANESALQNCESSGLGEVCWVEGNMSANIQYDIMGGFGLRKHTFYLPVLDDDEFSRKMGQYTFFDKRGALRAEDITSESATIGVYSGMLQNPYQGNSRAKQAYQKYSLKKGESTPNLLLPGMDCMASVKFKLNSIEGADTRARLRVNSQSFEVAEDEYFLDGKCKVLDVEKNGINKNVKIRCDGDDKKESFYLQIFPTVVLNIPGVDKSSYRVGDKLYESTDGFVYLGYATSDTDSSADLKVYLTSFPNDMGERLSTKDLHTAKYLGEAYSKNTENLGDFLKKASATVGHGTNWLFTSESIKEVSAGASIEFKGKEVEIVSFGSEVNSDINKEAEDYLDLAERDYNNIINVFGSERYPVNDKATLDERAMYNDIELLFFLGQKSNAKKICDKFKEIFPKSELDVSKCNNVVELANEGVSTRDVKIKGDIKEISFDGITQPSFEDYGAEILIKTDGGKSSEFAFLKKGQMQYLSEKNNDYIVLEEVADDAVKLTVSVGKKTDWQGVKDVVLSNSYILKKGTVKDFGTDYTFSLRKVNLKKVAKVTVDPSSSYQGSQAEFPFKIGVEKRAIQLAPEKAKKIADSIDNKIKKWDAISENLGKVVKTMKTACLSMGALMTAKNLIFNSGAKTVARQKVMHGEGGWYELCKTEVAKKDSPYRSLDACYLDHAKDIDREVSVVSNQIKKQQEEMKAIQKVEKSGLLGDKVIDTEDLANKMSSKVSEELNFKGDRLVNPDNEKESFTTSEIKEILDNQENFKSGIYDIEDLKQMQLDYRLYKETGNDMYKKRLFTSVKQLQKNYGEVRDIVEFDKSVENYGLGSYVTRPFSTKKGKDEVYDGALLTKQLGSIEKNTPVQKISYNHKTYLVSLKNIGANKFDIENIYDSTGSLVSESESDKIKGSYDVFEKYDSSSYKNTMKAPEVKFYENEPYKGLPAIVPFDSVNGWYAYVKQTAPTMKNIRTYDESGRLNSFYLCNVGANGLIETGSDQCQMVNLNGAYVNSFSGLSKSEFSSLTDNAVRAIRDVSVSSKKGTVSINGQNFKVGAPSLGAPSAQCSDYMSPKDCKILFNVCDPVICPNSRCDFGGQYPVNDVVQSGIIGSLVLCAPNINEGVYVPVCLTGVKAGIDGLLSVFGAYRDCLRHNIETGETIGMCDEVHSIYLCEFFWKQALPLAKIGIPQILKVVLGENVRGGGEYAGIQSAWNNAQSSINYFVQNYAINANKAFKARSQDQIGSAVCSNFVSVAYPKGQGLLDALTESDSPSQYTANFEEIPFSTATNPPTSHYKVFYHIFAGKDRGAYYKVYLRGGTSGSYYQDTDAGRMVGQGYIGRGEYATKTVDFTSPSGYKELCIQVNEEMKCGFKSVSSNFAQNYLKDQYTKRLTENTNIKTESECISGSSDVGGLLNLNIQAGVENTINPELYNRGIIRTCATENPGKGSDNYFGTEKARWKEVGICGDNNMKCWLDTETVDDSMEFEKTKDDTLESLEENYRENFEKAGNYLNDESFKGVVENISKLSNAVQRALFIETYFDKVFMNDKKAYLYLLRGDTYAELSKAEYSTSKSKQGSASEDVSGSSENVDEEHFREKKVTVFDLVEDKNFVSPEFTLREDTFWAKHNINFIFRGGEWNWRNPKITNVKWETASVENPQAYKLHISLIKALNDKDYLDGLKVLFDAVATDDYDRLSTEDVLYEKDSNDYVFRKEKNDLEMTFLYTFRGNINWAYSYSIKRPGQGFFDKGESFEGSVDDLENIDAKYKDAFEQDLSILKGRLKKEGGAIIFGGFDLSKLSVSSFSGDSGASSSTEMGQKIYSSAKSMVGQDTTRVQAGEEVRDNVCATFVSNALIEAGALPGFDSCSVETIPYRDAILELKKIFEESDKYTGVSEDQWLTGLKVGDVLVWGSTIDGYKPDYQHITIFGGYDENGNFKIVHDAGEARKIEEKTYSKSSHLNKRWYITHVWRYSGVASNEPTSRITAQSTKCVNTKECQELVARKIIDISKDVSIESSAESNLYSEIGVKSFGCFGALVALSESSLQFCKKVQENENPFYCEDNFNEVLGGVDKGVMQLNTGHIDKAFPREAYVSFDENVESGLGFLRDLYKTSPDSSNPKSYSCNGEKYSGWKAVLRYYNGWGTDCSKGNNNYVEDVIAKKSDLAKIVPECVL